MPSMEPYISDPDFSLYLGDVREVLAALPDESVNCVVTSPPYWGLRDYGTGLWDGGNPDCDHKGTAGAGGGSGGHSLPDTAARAHVQGSPNRGGDPNRCVCGATRVDQQLGLENTPDEYVASMVAVFREVRRVLRADGTCWLNLGDSYAGSGPSGASYESETTKRRREQGSQDGVFRVSPTLRDRGLTYADKKPIAPPGLKPKDLCGIPWMVAKALQEPYYTGSIRREADRAWLAAVVDSEGCIYISRSKAGSQTGRGRRSVRSQDAFDAGVKITNTNRALLERVIAIVGHGKIREATSHGRQAYEWSAYSSKARQLLCELYPHLVAKQHEARIAIGHPPSGLEATAAWESLKALHNGLAAGIDYLEPPSMFEPGWYLRSDVIWAKPNPMPESVTDRPTKAHEYVFLLTRSPRYWFDQEAVRETATWERWGGQTTTKYNGQGTSKAEMVQRRTKREIGETFDTSSRNVRSVWEIATQPYSEAHFATFPEELVRRCLLAGCPEWVCGTCGAPRMRVVDVSPMEIDRSDRTHELGRTRSSGTVTKPRESETVGWSDCGHDNWTAGTVLDPFMGSGTTALVARRHGRKAIGIELNAEYADLAARRLQQLSLLA